MVKKSYEKRKSKRHDINFIISIFQNKKPIALHNSVKDFSLNGCAIYISNNHSFQVNDVVELHVEENFLKKNLEINIEPIIGVIKYLDKENIFYAGIEFKNLSENNVKVIKYIIENGVILKKFPQTWQLSK
ncbi:PilZ domain-containing protein [Fluviispira vulneris]|uniref:PilZ domain-containing protein n=1 Tax=Fluviispira vulneris TaxID=2763012 RepID=UPI0016484694|nr:PilZ domain-containing protein [Fluviispira vulneris]